VYFNFVIQRKSNVAGENSQAKKFLNMCVEGKYSVLQTNL